MSHALTPENENFIKAAVANGEFPDSGRALNEAVELLRRRQRLIHDVNHGIEQIERGDVVAGDEVYQRLREKADRLRDSTRHEST